MKDLLYRILIKRIPALFFRLQHLRIHLKYGNHFYWARLNNPKTFNEFMLKDKLRLDKTKYQNLVDKYKVKDIVREKIGDEYIIPTIDYADSADRIEILKLTFPCIMKPTHLSGYIKIFNSDKEFNINEVKEIFCSLESKNLYDLTGESQYREVKPGMIFEELIVEKDEELRDYKFFCFDGKVAAIQVDYDRFSRHTRSFYDRHWKELKFSTMYPLNHDKIEAPMGLSKMIEIAEVLASGYRFMRVDLYNVKGKIYFGELTFHHGSGYEPFTTYEDDLFLGGYMKMKDENSDAVRDIAN